VAVVAILDMVTLTPWLREKCVGTFLGFVLTLKCFNVALAACYRSRIGGVVVSVFAIGPKGRGFEPGPDDGFLRAIKIRSTPSFGWEVKPKVPLS
jgi:hypothetical protein